MKDALLKIKERLSGGIDYLATKSADERAVYITADRTIPRVTDYPAIALKDGSESYSLSGGTLAPGAAADTYEGEFEKFFTVEVTAFVRLYVEEDLITGNGDNKGILDLVEDIKALLTGWLPGAAYTMPLVPVESGPSQVFTDEAQTVYIQMKTITFSLSRQD